MSAVLLAGHGVEGHPKRVSSSGPATVTIHKLGSSERSFFTPSEARALAKVLEEQADAAECTW